MPPLLIGLAILVGGFWLLRKYSRLTPRQSRVLTSKLVSLAIIAFSALLFLRGQFTLGSGLLIFGAGLYGTAELPDWKTLWRPRKRQPVNNLPVIDPRRMSALAILGLKEGASDEEIRKAHRQKMKDHHPDAGGDAEIAARINAAKDVLLG